ncbi:TPA: hypothetical protein NKZ51_003915 [Vibrio parahaemolyticus]|uniref:hypothetical protein n=1 Tax=Vibrio parahaemolyticus TaxID=670 RepID=UPI00235E221E|nr:hypothetical protein [Vibrio parahaemolyticus]HCG8254116.1 hypothetical protein [Vibrio parahaemolyticus]HCH5588593.1 hypothetical protein [Vibrio parahaemolyticus]
MAKFEDLPFHTRPDLSPYLVHLTKRSDEEGGKRNAFSNLVDILLEGKLIGSDRTGFIKGTTPATCFMDIPFSALKHVLNEDNTNPLRPRYEPYGIVLSKPVAYQNGCRPVLYLSDNEIDSLGITDAEIWRVVRLEVNKTGSNWISWMHEREWRARGDFELPSRIVAVLVKDLDDVKEFNEILAKKYMDFNSIPLSVIPLEVVCDGLPYLANES